MITLSALQNGGLTAHLETCSIDVFPATIRENTWTFLSSPEEEMTDPKRVSWPGEYDFSGVSVRALGQGDGSAVSYHLVSENVRLAFVNAPLLSWSDSDVSALGEVDVLAIAADDVKKVSALVEAVDPRILVLLPTEAGDIASVAKACGLPEVVPVKDMKIKVSTLPSDGRQVVVLSV